MMIAPQYYPLILALCAALAVVLIFITFAPNDQGLGARAIEKRLKRDGDAAPHRNTNYDTKNTASVRRNTKYSDIEVLDSILRRILPNPDRLRVLLERTGRSISISDYLMTAAATVFGVGLLTHFLTPLAPYICALIGILVGVVVPLKIIRIIGNRRVAAFMKEFTNAIDLIVRGLRSGLPFIESVNAVAKEFPNPLGGEFKRISDAVKLGQSLESAMWEVAERIDTPEFKFMIVAITIQRETGGNLAETLGNLSDLLRKRRALILKIRAMSSEARASAYIIGALPFVMFFMLLVVNYSYVSLLWTDHRGHVLVIKGLSSIFIGYYIMYRMVNFDF